MKDIIIRMIYVSLGVDCKIANTLQKMNKRKCSLPFDWVITYGGVAEIVKNNFNGYLPDAKLVTDKYFNKKYSVLFLHNHFPRDCEMMNKRSEKFIEILNSGEEKVIFIRKSHTDHHHKDFSLINTEMKLCLNYPTENLKNDIEDIIDFDNHLKTNYKKLNYEIHLILGCTKCFKKYKMQTELPTNIKIHNETHNNPIKNPSNDEYLYKICEKILN